MQALPITGGCRAGWKKRRVSTEFPSGDKFEKLLEELRNEIQNNFDTLSPLFTSAPAVDRTVPTRQIEDSQPIHIIPVEKSLEVSEEFVLPSQTIEEIIEKFDDIAVGYCFCRQRRSLLGDDCSTEAPTLN